MEDRELRKSSGLAGQKKCDGDAKSEKGNGRQETNILNPASGTRCNKEERAAEIAIQNERGELRQLFNKLGETPREIGIEAHLAPAEPGAVWLTRWATWKDAKQRLRVLEQIGRAHV